MDVTIGPLQVNDVDAADRIFRLAFGTRIGLPDPTKFGGDTALIRTRLNARHIAALGAYVEGELVGPALLPTGVPWASTVRCPYAPTCGTRVSPGIY